MIIDCILDRKDGERYGWPYSPEQFYRDVRGYGRGSSDDITMAMDYGEEEDVRRALCEYILGNHYNPAICDYVNSRTWLS